MKKYDYSSSVYIINKCPLSPNEILDHKGVKYSAISEVLKSFT